MFPASSVDVRPIAPELLPLARQIEERSQGLHILAARQFRYPVQQQKISVRIDHYRKVNLLEKFVLRALIEIVPAPSLEEIADALGLDPIFIESTFDVLRDRESITHANDGVQVTEEGKKTLSSETVSEEPSHESWYYLQDMILGTATFARHPLDEMDEQLKQLADLNHYVEQDLTVFPVFVMNPTEQQAQWQAIGLDAHDPEQGRFVTGMAPLGDPELRWRTIAIFVEYDSLCEDENASIICQAYSSDELLVDGVGEWLEHQLQEQHLSLKELCGFTDDGIIQHEDESQHAESSEEQIVEERLEEIRQQATRQLRLQAEGQTPTENAGTAIQLRDVEIRPAFLKALKEAHEQIIIYSPWMNEEVVDNAFLELLEDRVRRGVRILIGYGIGRDEKKEERPVSLSLIQRLRSVETVEGTPGIIAEWLGNSHAKEIVIDRKVHFSGSQNWLSYRGDRFPRGETVYQVTIATEVEKAYNHLAQRFIERARTLWARATDEERTLALCILGCLGYEQEALAWIQRDECYHCMPLWLALAHQAISAEHEIHISTSLQTLLLLYNSSIELADPLRTEIDRALQGVLKRLAVRNPEFIANALKVHPQIEMLYATDAQLLADTWQKYPPKNR